MPEAANGTAFAVAATPLRRKGAYSPASQHWTLYNPSDVADQLGLDVETVDEALEQTGFNKAVRIREELIRWKERLRNEDREVQAELCELHKRRRALVARRGAISEQLQNVRNILRIPREKSAARQQEAQDNG